MCVYFLSLGWLNTSWYSCFMPTVHHVEHVKQSLIFFQSQWKCTYNYNYPHKHILRQRRLTPSTIHGWVGAITPTCPKFSEVIHSATAVMGLLSEVLAHEGLHIWPFLPTQLQRCIVFTQPGKSGLHCASGIKGKLTNCQIQYKSPVD